MLSSRMMQPALGISTLTVIAVAAGYAQSPPTPSQDPVVLEIRALRADLNERLEATMRTQLLVARLQVQEQRTNNVMRQIQEVETKLRDNETSKEQMEQALKMFTATNKPGAQDEEEMKLVMGPLRANLEKAAKTDADLKIQQTQLMATLADEQARWIAFNTRLDELEAMFGTPRKPAR